jgi:hypothetical protein
MRLQRSDDDAPRVWTLPSRLVLVAALALCSVTRADSTPPPGISGKAATRRQLQWTPKQIPNLGLTIDLLKGAAIGETAWKDGGGTVYQTLPLDDGELVRVSLRAGAGEGLEAFRGDHVSWALSPPEKGSVCGEPARVQRATYPAQHIACVMVAKGTPGGNHPAYVAASVATTVVFEHHGVPVRLIWELESDKNRSALEAALAHFFQSVRCR